MMSFFLRRFWLKQNEFTYKRENQILYPPRNLENNRTYSNKYKLLKYF